MYFIEHILKLSGSFPTFSALKRIRYKMFMCNDIYSKTYKKISYKRSIVSLLDV